MPQSQIVDFLNATTPDAKCKIVITLFYLFIIQLPVIVDELKHHGQNIRLDWIEQGLTSPPTQYRLSGKQLHRPNNNDNNNNNNTKTLSNAP